MLEPPRIEAGAAMRVLLVGSGGREHALAWAIAASPVVTKLWAAPGNPGTATVAENVHLQANDVAGLVRFAREQQADLVVSGPEAPLVEGLADAMAAAGIRCFGPSAAAARLEGSKAFAKEVCDAAGIATARWERFSEAAEAVAFVRRRGAPIVVKADGLAGGKGVVVAASVEVAEAAVHELMASGGAVVIEECLSGPECSLFALCDGTDAVFLGAATPVPGFDGAAAMEAFIRPALAEMVARGAPFRGILFAGLMLTADGPRLIEYNVRFGDPECQAMLPLLRSDLLPGLLAACDGELRTFDLRWREGACVAVVMAARGYPADPELDTVIDGLEAAASVPGALVFQAGTRVEGGRLLAAGGRALTICGTGADLAAARAVAYAAVDLVRWPEGFCRRDIALA